MQKDPFLDEYYRLWLLLSMTRSAIYKARHRKFGRYMHPNQAAALIMIGRYDGQITPTLLANNLFLEPHSISELIDRMHKKGLVVKTKDRSKGHVVRISLTEEGRALTSELVQTDFIRNLMTSLTPVQRQQLWSCLTILFQATLKELGVDSDLPPHFQT